MESQPGVASHDLFLPIMYPMVASYFKIMMKIVIVLYNPAGHP